VRQRTPGRDQLIANLAREGDVRVAVAVHMPELAPPEAEFHAAEAVSADLDVGPGSDDGADAGACAGLLGLSRNVITSLLLSLADRHLSSLVREG
jgi:hypothetical protein